MKKSHSELSKNEPVCMCKEGWYVGLGQEGVFLREGGGNCMKYLKKRWGKKEEGKQNFHKKGGGGASWVKEWVP